MWPLFPSSVSCGLPPPPRSTPLFSPLPAAQLTLRPSASPAPFSSPSLANWSAKPGRLPPPDAPFLSHRKPSPPLCFHSPESIHEAGNDANASPPPLPSHSGRNGTLMLTARHQWPRRPLNAGELMPARLPRPIKPSQVTCVPLSLTSVQTLYPAIAAHCQFPISENKSRKSYLLDFCNLTLEDLSIHTTNL